MFDDNLWKERMDKKEGVFHFVRVGYHSFTNINKKHIFQQQKLSDFPRQSLALISENENYTKLIFLMSGVINYSTLERKLITDATFDTK